jgi:cell fate regulator YaaT (PSP1 superfamily)
MANIIGVRFRTAGKLYYFEPESEEIRLGSYVIVETARGIECGRVVLAPTEVEGDKVVQPLKKVIRTATAEDIGQMRMNQEKASEAFSICKKKIREHHLEMKLIGAEYTFDRKKILFYFTADGRVDFRGLIKDLASIFKTRIELRQIGVRDETKMLGGIGICGRPLCCCSHMADFIPVSIKMAKEQNLSLNPTKISGACGRLMCCLKNEADTYEYLNRNLPGIGDTVRTEDGLTGEVQSVNILRQQVRVLSEQEDETTVDDYPASGLTIVEKHKKGVRRRKERDVLAEKAAAAAERAAERRNEREAKRRRHAEHEDAEHTHEGKSSHKNDARHSSRGSNTAGSSAERSSGKTAHDAGHAELSAERSSGKAGHAEEGSSASPEKKRRRRRSRSKKKEGAQTPAPEKSGE